MELPTTLYNLTGALLARGYSEQYSRQAVGRELDARNGAGWVDPRAQPILDEDSRSHEP